MVFFGFSGTPVKRNSLDKNQKNIRDMLLYLHEMDTEPRFMAHDIHRLPPVSINHLDATVIVQDTNQLILQMASLCDTIQGLVHGQTAMKIELQTLHEMVAQASDHQPIRKGAAPEAAQATALPSRVDAAMIEIVEAPILYSMVGAGCGQVVEQGDGELAQEAEHGPTTITATEAGISQGSYAGAVIGGLRQCTRVCSCVAALVTCGSRAERSAQASAGIQAATRAST